MVWGSPLSLAFLVPSLRMTWISGVDSVPLFCEVAFVQVAVAPADDEVGPDVVVSYEGSVEVSAG